MSGQITTAMVQQYNANVTFLLQQQGSIFREAVENTTITAEFEYFDRIGATEMVENNSRHGDTPLVYTPHDRRRLSLRDFDWADLLDRKDKIRTLIDPTSTYATNAAFAAMRKQDDIIIEGFYANAQIGKTGASSAAFDTSNMRIPINYVESGSAVNSGLTIAKLRRARTILRSKENLRNDPWYIGVSPEQIQDLLQTTSVTSSDFSTVKALVQGEIDSFLGFKFLESNRLTTIATNQRRCPFWTKSGMLFGSGEEIMTDIGPRRDKRNSIQVYVNTTFGVVRMEEFKVGDIICDES